MNDDDLDHSCNVSENSQLQSWAHSDRVRQHFRDGYCTEYGEYLVTEGDHHPYPLCLTHTSTLYRHKHELFNRPVTFDPDFCEITEEEDIRDLT